MSPALRLSLQLRGDESVGEIFFKIISSHECVQSFRLRNTEKKVLNEIGGKLRAEGVSMPSAPIGAVKTVVDKINW